MGSSFLFPVKVGAFCKLSQFVQNTPSILAAYLCLYIFSTCLSWKINENKAASAAYTLRKEPSVCI